MRRIVLVLAASVFFGGARAQADGLTANMSSVNGSSVTFTPTGGGSAYFQFNGVNPSTLFANETLTITSPQFQLTSINGTPVYSVNSSNQPVGNLYGEILGKFNFTPTSGNPNSASVTGTGEFEIDDGQGYVLTANVTFRTIQSNAGTGDSTSGQDFVGFDGVVNLTSLSYGGSNSALQALAALGSADLDASILFTPKNYQDLYQVATASTSTTVNSFTLTLTDPVAAPAPASWLMLLSGGGLVGGLRLRRRRGIALA